MTGCGQWGGSLLAGSQIRVPPHIDQPAERTNELEIAKDHISINAQLGGIVQQFSR